MKTIAETTYQDKLREAGIRITVPRLRIYDYLQTHRTHPTCDVIYKDLKAGDDSLSLASVYNVTEKLAQAGLIKELISPDGQKHYDGIIEFHGHFFCKECGMIMDVDCCKDFYPDKQLDGARVDSMSLIMNGVCKNCLI